MDVLNGDVVGLGEVSEEAAKPRTSRRKSHDRLLGFSPGLYILLALAEGPGDGVQVWWRIVGDTLGSYVRRSSLYDEIKRLERAKFIERVGGRGWMLTAEGRRRLKLEMGTLRWVREESFPIQQ